MNWKLPNQLTMARLVLAGVFFALLGVYPRPTPAGARGAGPLLLDIAFVLYIIAGITDVLDGYLARKWDLTSAFGRIVDPFVDKVLVVGAFAMLTGSNFVLVEGFHTEWERSLPTWLTGGMASCVQAWMVVVVLSREMMVSAVRGYSESQGVEFPATVWGKGKMLTQSVAICTLLIGVSHVTHARWAVVVKLLVVWISVLVTVVSGFAYVAKARKLLVEAD